MIQTRSTVILVLVASLVSACGLGMDTQDRLDRGQEALVNGEYRAAIIDAKDILQDEPDNVAARLLLGRASVAISDGVSAEKELRKAIQLGADNGVVLADLGRAMLLQRKFDQIVAEIDPDLATSEPDRLTAMRTLGDALIGLRQFESAREMFGEVLASNADDVAAQLGIVQSYFGERNYLQARETLNYVLASDENSIPALQLSGVLNMEMRNLERAAMDFERAAEIAQSRADHRSEIQALSSIVDVNVLQDNPEKVRVVLQRMTEVGPQDLRTIFATARLAVADRDWITAQASLQQILRRAPDFRPAQKLLGVVHKESGNLGQAEMYLSAAVASAPQDPVARQLLAETRLASNKMEGVRQILEPLTGAASSDILSLSMAAGANLSLGDVDEAVNLLKRGIATDPDNLNLNIQLALTYFQGRRFKEAQQILESLPDMPGGQNVFRIDVMNVLTQMALGEQARALENARSLREDWRDRVEIHGLVGSIEMATGDLEMARKSFDEGLKLAPDNILIIRYLAQLDVAEDNPQAAQDRYLLIHELDPDDSSAMVSLARIAALSEDQAQTREWLEKARAADPSSVSARSLLSALYLVSRQFPLAEKVAREAVDLNPNSGELHNYLGLAQSYGKKYREAVLSFGKAVELAPDEQTYRFNLARAQAAQGNFSSALVSLQDSVDQTLQHIPSGALLASTKAKLGDLDGALDIAHRLQEMHPNEAVPYALEAEFLARQDDLPAAVSAIDKALDIDIVSQFAVRAYQFRKQLGTANQVEPLLKYVEARPLDSDMRNYLANAYQAMGEIGNANTQYELVLAQDPDNVISINNLAWNFVMDGDSRAEGLARRAYKLQPDNSSVVDTLGWILVKNGSLDDGIVMLRNAAELEGSGSETRFHLATGLASAGQTAEAKTILQELLATEDEFSSRKEAESLLNTL